MEFERELREYAESVMRAANTKISTKVLEAEAKTKSQRICGNCQYFYAFEDGETGECGRGETLIIRHYLSQACKGFSSNICPYCNEKMSKEYLRSESTSKKYFRYFCQKCHCYYRIIHRPCSWTKRWWPELLYLYRAFI